MDLGTYNVLTLRQILGTEQWNALKLSRLMPGGWDQKCDQAFMIKWRLPKSRNWKSRRRFAMTGGWPLPWITRIGPVLEYLCAKLYIVKSSYKTRA